MNDEKTSLTAALRHLAEQERRTPSEHATPGELTAYHEGTLPEPIEARVREHLAHCKLCSDLLLDLAGFADLAPPPGVPELTDAEVEEDWQALRARMGEGEQKPATVVPFPTPAAPTPARPPLKRRPWRYAAAALLAATVGLSAWMLIPRQQLPTNHLYDGGTLRGGDESPSNLTLSRQTTAFHFSPFEDYPRYEGRILRDGKEVWKTSEVHPSKDETIFFEIPAGSLKPGRYEAALYGLRQGRREPIGSFGFEVHDP